MQINFRTVDVIALIVAGLLSASWPLAAQTVPPLGAAQDVTILGGMTVTNTGATLVNGNVALSPGSAITGFPPGIVSNGAIHINDALANQAHADASTAFNNLANLTATTNLTGTDLGALTLTPGVYKFDSSAGLTGTLTLNNAGNPNAAFVFQIGTTLTTATGSAVVLSGSLTDPNIFWQVGTSATFGSTSAFDGNVLASVSITLNPGASLVVGRELALGGAVTLAGGGNTINLSGPGALALTPTGAYWKGGTSNLWSGVNWSPDATGATSSTLFPGAAVVFSETGVPAQNQNTNLDADETIASLTVNDPVAVSISGAHTLTVFGTAGATSTVTINSGAALTTINSNLALSGLAQGITVNNTAGLQINGVVEGTIGLTKEGTGSLYLTNANTYTGGTAFGLAGDVTAGTVEIGTGVTNLTLPVIPPTIAPFGAGDVTVNAATTLTTDGATTSNSYTLANNFILAPPLTVNVPTATTLIMSGNLTGADGLTVNNPTTFAGTLVLSGNNSYGLGGTVPNEETTVDAGTLQAGSNTALSANSDVVLNNTAKLDLAGFSNSVGSLNGGAGTTVTSSAGVPNNPALLTLAGTPNTPVVSTFSGNLNDGAGKLALAKNDGQTLVLNGGGSYSGGTTINAGKLAVGSAGALGNGFVTNKATLETTATPIPVTAVTAPQKINVNGVYTQTASGTLLLQVATSPAPTPSNYSGLAGINYDTLAATGAASLGGILDLNFKPASVPSQGQRYVAVTAGAPLATEFVFPTTTNLATFDPSFYTVTTYNDTFGASEPADSAIVTLLKPFASFPGLTPNQTNVARNIDSNLSTLNNNGSLGMPTGVNKDFFDNIVTGLNSSTYANNALGSALDELSPQRFEILRNVAFDNYAFDVQNLDNYHADVRDGQFGLDTRRFAMNDSTLGPELSQVESRLLAWSPTPDSGLLSDVPDSLLSGVEMTDAKDLKEMKDTGKIQAWNAFIDGGVDLGDLEHNSDVSHSSYTTGKVRGGADFHITTDLRVGALFGYNHTDVNLDHEGSSATVDSYTPGLYASYATKSGFYANGLFTYTRNDYSTDREIVLPGVNRTANGSTSGNQFGGDLDGGYDYRKNGWVLSPSIGLTYVNLGIDSFNESGAGAASLSVNDQSAESLRSRLGGSIRYETRVGSVVLKPHVSAFWQHEFLDNSTLITSAFEGLPAGSFSVTTTKGDKDNALLGIGLDADITGNLTLFIDYGAEAGGASFFGQSATAGVKLGF